MSPAEGGVQLNFQCAGGAPIGSWLPVSTGCNAAPPACETTTTGDETFVYQCQIGGAPVATSNCKSSPPASYTNACSTSGPIC